MKKRKHKRDKKEEIREELEKSLKDIQEQLEDLKESGMVDPSKINVISIKVPVINGKRKIMFKIFDVLLSILLFFGISGYINWAKYSNIYYFLLAGGIFTVLEILIREGIDLLLPRFAVYSFGAYIVLASVISFIVAIIITPSFSTVSITSTIFFFIIYMISRLIIRFLVLKRFIVVKTIKTGDDL